MARRASRATHRREPMPHEPGRASDRPGPLAGRPRGAPGRRMSRTSSERSLSSWPSKPAFSRLGPEVDPRDDLDPDDQRDDPVDGGAERWPPPGAGDVLAALLPRLLDSMGREPERKEPRRSSDPRRGDHHEPPRDTARDQHEPPP